MRLVHLIALLTLASCAGERSSSKKKLNLAGTGTRTVLVNGANNTELANEARAQGMNVQGDVILRIIGEVEDLNELEIDAEADVMLDESAGARHLPGFSPEDGALYLAKKDFGILEFWKENPTADGRGVVVGVFDDGISPNQSGFRTTTTGGRKLLKRGSSSSFSTYTLVQNGELWEGEIVEDKPVIGTTLPDLNGDGKKLSFKAKVQDSKVCLDLNIDSSFSEDECRGTFAASGEYFILPGTANSMVAEFDATTGKLKLSQPEVTGDSHGEGVASVMAGYNQGHIPGMDGVAPGAQIVDFDLSEATDIPSENDYTMGTILLGLEWLAQNGAEVANISYSLFFSSVKAQDFMAKAVDALVKKYNIVLSFSAGNNGPALGTLNRKAIYPDSVLVAGAFVSKELDERVWGVTGLPEEGRVVYYSSRGPGPLGDHGPVLISPLSSLTHSTPGEGYRAFNGTSSASPALAGAAAVLISAIKQEGLKVDAPTVVQALRLSGKRLKAEPFVSQGYGLPQVSAALQWYRRLLAGEQFMNVGIRVSRGAQDTIGARGLLLLKSQSGVVESARVDLTGILSAAAPVNARNDLLVPLTISYSKGITGAGELWTSVSGSRFYIDVNTDEMLEGTEGEAFGEIKLTDSRTGDLLAIVPVTVLNDRLATTRQTQTLTVGSQGSARMHLNIPAGVQAVKVKARVLEGDSSVLNLAVTDSHRVRNQQIAFTDELWITVNRAGHHQVALLMAGGTARTATVELVTEPISVELKNTATSAEKPKLSLKHVGLSALHAKIELVPVSAPFARVISEVGGDVKALELSTKLTSKTGVSVVLKPLESADISYFYPNCTIQVIEADGKVSFVEAAVYTAPDEKERTLNVRCIPFDHGITGTHGLGWELSLQTLHTAVETKPLSLNMRGSTELEMTKQAPGRYLVWVISALGGQRVRLGEIDLL